MGMSLHERENHSVEAYLRYLATGELPVDEQKQSKLEALDARIAAEERLYRKAMLIGERHAVASEGTTKEDLQERFVKYVGGFMVRNRQVTYAVWREMGVPAAVLKEAGVEGAPAAVRPRTGPRRTRNDLNDPNVARTILSYAWANGGDATAEHFQYKRSYIPKVCRDLAERNPEVAAEVGYKHEVIFPMTPSIAAAQATLARKRAS